MAISLRLMILAAALVSLLFGHSVRETFFLRKSLRRLLQNELRNSVLSTVTRDKYVKTLYELSAFPLTRNSSVVAKASKERNSIGPTLQTAPFTIVDAECSPRKKVS